MYIKWYPDIVFEVRIGIKFVVKYIKRISESPADLHHEEQCHSF